MLLYCLYTYHNNYSMSISNTRVVVPCLYFLLSPFFCNKFVFANRNQKRKKKKNKKTIEILTSHLPINCDAPRVLIVLDDH